MGWICSNAEFLARVARHKAERAGGTQSLDIRPGSLADCIKKEREEKERLSSKWYNYMKEGEETSYENSRLEL